MARTAYEDAQRFASFRAAAALRLGENAGAEGILGEAEATLNEEFEPGTPLKRRACNRRGVAIKIASGEVEDGKALARSGNCPFPAPKLSSQ